MLLKIHEVVGTFYKKELQKTNQKDFRVGNVIKRKDNKLNVKQRGYDNFFNSWIDQKGLVYMREYFLGPKFSGGRVKVELDLPNYATKADFKNATCVGTSKFAEKCDFANLKFKVDNLEIDKLKNVPTNFSNLKSKKDKLYADK